MKREHHKRTYTFVKGRSIPISWKLVTQSAIANASVKLTEYYLDLRKRLHHEDLEALDIKRVETPFVRFYQFGANSVTEQCVQYAEDPAMIINAISERGLTRLLAITELDRFEPDFKKKKE